MATTKAIGRYANILLDYWFKRTFGEDREQLMRLFLQELIPERKIVKLTYAPQEHVNPWPGQKDIRVDVECTDEDGTRFVVEMQLAPQEFFYERAVFNSSFAIQEQLEKGPEEYDFPTVYFIGLTNFSIHKGSDNVMYRYSIREDSTGEQMTPRLQYIFLELPNSTKAMAPGASVVDKLCYALHNMQSFKEIPSEFKGEIFNLLFDSAEIAKFTPSEKIKYENDMTTERDIHNQIRFAKKQGIQEGIEKGAEQERLAIARQMLAKGYSPSDVAEITGLTPEALAKL
ncbi:MAG: Rpn family recombination-promoting nuclease/putative transposase [Bacteroidales bacterium]|nr:Rpn family recombination-promoting nuclease/putative transposase [Bacteroidales bacterium]